MNNGTQFSADYGWLESASKDLSKHSTNIQTCLDKVKTELQKIGSGNGIWDGDAATQVKQTFNKLLSNVDDFYKVVAAFSKAIAESKEMYVKADNANMGK